MRRKGQQMGFHFTDKQTEARGLHPRWLDNQENKDILPAGQVIEASVLLHWAEVTGVGSLRLLGRLVEARA